MAIKLEWSEEALEDIESIATYIEKDSPAYAKSVVSKFFEKLNLVLQNAAKEKINAFCYNTPNNL